MRVTLLSLDPKWEGAKEYFKDRNEPKYLADISQSIEHLKAEQERLLKLGLPGEFQIYLYRSFPSMHLLCVDPEDQVNGRMLASPYAYGLTRSESPVLELSRLSNSEMFTKYWNSIKKLLRYKSELYD